MFVFTDMQFNDACSNERITFENNDSNDSLDTVYKTIVKKYILISLSKVLLLHL